ncbi:MAG: guanylate kinase [Myxococcota bacterium]
MSARTGIPFVLSAPSGTGKTTVCRALVAADAALEFSISHTTRTPRASEKEGVHYHFVTAAEFQRMAAAGGFVEYAEYAGHLYGTSWAAIEAPLARGEDLLLEVDVQGALQLRERRPDARLVFLLPPSFEELRRRLESRGTDGPEAVERRLALVRRELEALRRFDYAVVNEEVEASVAAVREIIDAERAGDVARVKAVHGVAAVASRVADVLPI